MRKAILLKLACLNDSNLEILQRLLKTRDALMPHQLAGATGCSLNEAMQLLLSLFDQGLAELLLLVYHRAHPDVPIQSRNLLNGFPQLPFLCSECEDEIMSKDELLYDFLFRIPSPIELL
jgi:hypothetical protein